MCVCVCVCVCNFLYWQFFNGYMLNYSVMTKAYISFSIERNMIFY